MGCGVVAVLSGLSSYIIAFSTNAYASKPYDSLSSFLIYTLWFIVTPLLATIGSYLYLVKRKRLGIVLMVISTVLASLELSGLCYVILLSWYYPTWLAIVSLAPIVMTLLTMALATVIAVRQNFHQ